MNVKFWSFLIPDILIKGTSMHWALLYIWPLYGHLKNTENTVNIKHYKIWRDWGLVNTFSDQTFYCLNIKSTFGSTNKIRQSDKMTVVWPREAHVLQRAWQQEKVPASNMTPSLSRCYTCSQNTFYSLTKCLCSWS